METRRPSGLAYGTRLALADGTSAKAGLVFRQADPRVLTFDPANGLVPLSPLATSREGPTPEWVKLEVAAGGASGRRKLAVTPDQLVLTPAGPREAGELREGDFVSTVVRDYELTDDQQALIVGSVLGDGSLRLIGEHRACFRVGHGEKQIDLARWKAAMLAPVAGPLRLYTKEAGGLAFDTIPLLALADLQREIYRVDRSRTVSDAVVRRLDARAVAMWYADDGTYSGSYARWGHGKAEITNKTLTPEDKERLADRLAELGMGRATVRWNGLLFSGARTALLHEAIAPYLPPPVAYKLHPRLRDRFAWEPPAEPGTRASRERLTVRPMPVTRIRREPAEPRRRTVFSFALPDGAPLLADFVLLAPRSA